LHSKNAHLCPSAQVESELSQSEDWSIKAADPAGQSDSLPYNASKVLVGCDQAATAAAEHLTRTQESAFAESPAKLLQIQAQDAADRAAQRQQKQQQVLLLQQTLAKQQYAAGMCRIYVESCRSLCKRVEMSPTSVSATF